LVSCRVGFHQNLGSKKSLMDPTWCKHNFLGHQQPQGHNKQESATFILPYGSNKQYCMDEEEFHWIFGVLEGWFSAKLGVKNQWWILAVSTIAFITNSHRDITNRNQPLLFFHMDPKNSIVWTRWSFIGSLVSWRVGFHQNLGSKISDGSQLM
jgi:hypothetical protein